MQVSVPHQWNKVCTIYRPQEKNRLPHLKVISSPSRFKNSFKFEGTDVLGMATKAIEDEATKSWLMTGQKMWITNGTLDDGKTTGDLFLVYARTGPNRSDITSFLVEKNMPGFSVGQKIDDKLGMRASVSTWISMVSCIWL